MLPSKMNYLYPFGTERLLMKSMARNYPLIKPANLSINITTRCNSRCIYCDCWKSGGPAIKEPALEDIKRLYISITKLGVHYVSLSGGEPLLRDDLEAMIAVLS